MNPFRTVISCISVTCLLLGAFPSFSQLVDEKVVQLTRPYQDLSGLGKYLYDSAFYESTRKQQDFDFVTFTYPSDELLVEGFLCRPAELNKKLPLIIYNRGGTGNFGKLTNEVFPYFYELAKEGFIVAGTNYRFVGENGKNDEIGGVEINDVINLIDLMKTLPYVDTENVFMLGISRGGLMTYLASAKTEMNAVAVIGGVADNRLQTLARPIFLEGWDDLSEEENYRGLRNILPDFDRKKEQYMRDRSPVLWADQIKNPVLILHSRQDGRVKPDQALLMAQALQKANKPYQLKIYDRKSHSLPSKWFDSAEEVVSWFKTYLEP